MWTIGAYRHKSTGLVLGYAATVVGYMSSVLFILIYRHVCLTTFYICIYIFYFKSTFTFYKNSLLCMHAFICGISDYYNVIVIIIITRPHRSDS